MRSVLVVCLSLLLGTTALAAASKSNSKDVSYKSGNETVHGILYTPQGKGPFPGLIVIHEWWGLNDWVKEQASKLSDQGYIALAIDLYRGKVAATPNEAHEFMGGVPQERAKRDLQAAFNYLESQSDVKKDRIGAIGWCMGGGYALQLALDEPKLTADVINYGVYDYESLVNNPAEVQKINASILGLYGAQDRGIPIAELRKFFQELIQQKKKADFEIYPDAGHAFQNPNNKDGYRPKDAEKAWNRTVTFLATTLKK
jgi:carboxymethylenebutenolidase